MAKKISSGDQFRKDMRVIINHFEELEEDFYNNNIKNKTYNGRVINREEVPMFLYHRLFTEQNYDWDMIQNYIDDEAKMSVTVSSGSSSYTTLMRKGNIFEDLGARLMSSSKFGDMTLDIFGEIFDDVKDLHLRGDVLLNTKATLDFKYTEQYTHPEKVIVKANSNTYFKNVSDIERTIIDSLHFEGASVGAIWKPKTGTLIWPEDDAKLQTKLKTTNPKTLIFMFPSGAMWTSDALESLVDTIANELDKHDWQPLNTRSGSSVHNLIDSDGINRHSYLGLFYGKQ